MNSNRISRRAALTLFGAAATLAITGGASARQAGNDAITGIWQADDGSVKLEMFKAGPEYQARLLYGNQLMEADGVTFRKDEKNPVRALRSRSMKHVVFITGLEWKNGSWTGGSLYDGSSGRTYSCEVTIRDGKLNLRGYIGISALGQTRTFHRVNA